MSLKRKLLVILLGAVLFAAAMPFAAAPVAAVVHNLATAEGGCGGG